MARVIYGSDHHKQAFEIWREARTFTRVGEIMDIGLDTVRAWSKADFNCLQGCQWHNWEKLVADEALALSRRMQLYEEGNVDPIAHNVATQDVMRSDERNPKLQKARREVMDKLVRSDLERAAQWELLWSKVYFQVTGICLDHRTVIVEGKDVQTGELYAQGLKVTNMEGGIRALFTVQSQIDKLKERMGVYKSDVKKDEEDKSAEKDFDVETLSIEEVRKFQQLVENTPPDQLELLKRMLRRENEILAQHVPPAQENRRSEDRDEGRLGDMAFTVPSEVPVTNEQS